MDSKPPLVSHWVHSGPELSEVATRAGSSSTSWKAFTTDDDARIERAWQSLGPAGREWALAKTQREEPDAPPQGFGEEVDLVLNLEADALPHVVPVGPDSLFTLDLSSFRLVPGFWRGPSVNVQRASWFFPTTKPNRYYPCEHALSIELERAYDTIQPWSASYADELRSAHKHGADAQGKLRMQCNDVFDVIFSGRAHARLLPRGFSAGLSKSFLDTVLGSARATKVGGTLVVRGFDNAKGWRDRHRPPVKDSKPAAGPAGPPPTGDDNILARPASKLAGAAKSANERIRHAARGNEVSDQGTPAPPSAETIMSSTTELAMEEESSDPQAPPDVLVLVVHGIGQQLAEIWDSFSFVHAVTFLRWGCQRESQYEALPTLLRGRRAQFIPVMWRQQLDFNRSEGAQEPFTLDDIQVKESVPLIRSIVKDLVLDVPLYMTNVDGFVSAVVEQCNLVYRLFVSRNPGFVDKGTVSIIGHSLGSVLVADILSRQPTFVKSPTQPSPAELDKAGHFCFDTDQVFFLGSPCAFFLHLRASNLVPRTGRRGVPDGTGSDAVPYGCLALNTLYGIYAKNDVVAWLLNPTVDRSYAQKFGKAISVPAALSCLTRLLRPEAPASFWARSKKHAPAPAPDAPVTGVDEHPRRPAGTRAPSAPIDPVKFAEAKARMRSLNPMGCLDFELPPTSSLSSVNAYLDVLSSHSMYWTSPLLHRFLLMALFGDESILDRLGSGMRANAR